MLKERMVAGYHVDCEVQILKGTPLCAVKSSFKTGLQISLWRSMIYKTPVSLETKTDFQIGDHFFLNLNSEWSERGGKKGEGMGERRKQQSGGELLSNLSKPCSYSKTNKKYFSEEVLVILLVGYKENNFVKFYFFAE
jgi:hypothetical protein